MKKSVHIIYLADDGVSSLVCGVGTIVNNFLLSINDIAEELIKENIYLKLSVISLKCKKTDIGFRPDFLVNTKNLCRKYNGSFILIDKPKFHNDDYFDFYSWNILNKKIRVLLKSVHKKSDDLSIVIANDTIFADSYLTGSKVVNIWLPNSLSFLHKQSYVDQNQRLRWEEKAINRAKRYNNYFVGSVSDFVTKKMKQKFNLPPEKIFNLHNGFYLPELKKCLYDDKEIINYLLSRKIPLNKDIIFCFSRADEYKGLDISLIAMLKISKKHNLFPVLVASKFSEEKLVLSIQKKLQLIADKSLQEVALFFGYEFILPKYLLQYSRVKFLLNLPTNDFCPLIPYEAEILGHNNLCVINSNISCFKEVITDMKNGFLSPAKPWMVSNKVDKILNLSFSKKSAIIKRGKLRAIKQMDIKKNYLNTLSLIINRYI